MNSTKSKAIILFLLIIILILLSILNINIPQKEQPLLNKTEKENTKIEKIDIETNIEPLIEEIKKEQKELIIENFINYKYHTRLNKLALNSLQFNSKFFGIDEIKSKIDYDNDGIDDFKDILNGAKDYVNSKPIYLSNYYDGGYPPKEEGVCTDVIWNALAEAGYTLKDLVDEDIKKNKTLYPATQGIPDPNIDFRRVRNLDVFFARHVQVLTTDTSKIEEWNPGDIITYSNSHIGVVSNLRNYKGVPLLIHHGGRTPAGEYNVLESPSISGHYRIIF